MKYQWKAYRSEITVRQRLHHGMGVLLLTSILGLCPPLFSQGEPAHQQEIQSHLHSAQEALKSGNTAAAAREFQSILAIDPKNVDARFNLGVMRFFQGEWADAAEQFKEVLKVQPNLTKAQALLGMCQKRMGQTNEARRLLDESFPRLQGSIQTQAGLDLVEIIYQAGDIDKALGTVRVLERANPTNADVLYAAYRIYMDQANHTRESLAMAAPGSARMHELMAQHLINEGDIASALAQYRKALAIDPKLHGVHFELGEAMLLNSVSASALAEAEEQFRIALAENPGNAGAEYGLGRVSAERRDWKDAITHYSQAVQFRPDYANAQLGLGAALQEVGESEKAEEHLLVASRLDPLNSRVHYRLSMLYRALGRDSEAHRELSLFNKLQEDKERIRQVYQQMHLAYATEEINQPGPPKK
jgi:tetratricopeptide (TPR) repeat protein